MSVAQEESQQQAEVLPLVLVGDEQRLGAGEHLTEANRESESDGEQDVSGEEMKWVYGV